MRVPPFSNTRGSVRVQPAIWRLLSIPVGRAQSGPTRPGLAVVPEQDAVGAILLTLGPGHHVSELVDGLRECVLVSQRHRQNLLDLAVLPDRHPGWPAGWGDPAGDLSHAIDVDRLPIRGFGWSWQRFGPSQVPDFPGRGPGGAEPGRRAQRLAVASAIRGDPAVVGRSVELGKQIVTVIGVMPPQFTIRCGAGPGPTCGSPSVWPRSA